MNLIFYPKFPSEAGNFWNNPRKIKIKITVLQTISNQNHV